MYCPNCSAEASKDQKFCRSCGMDLHAVAELIGAQTNITKPEQAKEFPHRQRSMLVWGMVLVLAAAAFGSSLKVLGKEHIQPAGDFTPYLMVINLFIALFGMGLMCYPVLQSIAPRQKHGSRHSAGSDPTIKLGPDLLAEEPSSITEQTTNFLEASPIGSQVRDTAPRQD